MVTALTTQSSWFARSGQFDVYTAGTAGQIRNPGDVRPFGRYAVDVSGAPATVVSRQPFQAGPGIAVTSPGSRTAFDPSTMGTLLQLQDIDGLRPNDLNGLRQQDSSRYIAAVPNAVAVQFTPAGAEPQSVEGLGFIPGDVFRSGHEVDYIKAQIVRAGDLANLERQLGAASGADVKLAFDPLGQDYILLHPGQAGYDRVSSARDVFGRVVQDVGRRADSQAYRDVLARYGVT